MCYPLKIKTIIIIIIIIIIVHVLIRRVSQGFYFRETSHSVVYWYRYINHALIAFFERHNAISENLLIYSMFEIEY